MKLASSNAAPPEDRAVTSLTSQAKKPFPPAAVVQAMGHPEKSLRKTMIVVTIAALCLMVLVWLWWSRK